MTDYSGMHVYMLSVVSNNPPSPLPPLPFLKQKNSSKHCPNFHLSILGEYVAVYSVLQPHSINLEP